MQLKARVMEFEARKAIVILNKDDAAELDVKPLDRVELVLGKRKDTAIVNIAEKLIKEGEIGLYESVVHELKAKEGSRLKIARAPHPASIEFIRKKLEGRMLDKAELDAIIGDVVGDRLSDIEISSFLTALHEKGMVMDEVAALSRSMAENGKRMKWKKVVFDKHSIGGVPGDKTSILLVPTIAAAGFTIPKTSSRAITSPAGTADRFECIAPVDLSWEEIKKVVNKTKGCLAWGGAVDLAPADDIFIKVEYPLSIDPMLLPSVMSKKVAVGAKHLVIDIPTGRGTKIKSISSASDLAGQFIELGSRLGIDVRCLSTFGEQPLGHTIGPALEAREALHTALTGKGPTDYIDKVTALAGTLMGMGGMKNAEAKARHIITSGKAGRKLKQIIAAQGGDPDIKPKDIEVGGECCKVSSNFSGRVWWISNKALVHIAKSAGAPKDKGAGIFLNKKIGDRVRKGETIFEIFSDKPYKLKAAVKAAEGHEIMGIGRHYNMVLKRMPEEKHEKTFILER